MKTKTMNQRIALFTVSVLTAGIFSIITAPIASAAVGDVDDGGGSTGVVVAYNEGTANEAGTITITSAGTVDIDVLAQTGGAVSVAQITGGTFTAIGSGGTIAAGGLTATSAADTIMGALIATPTAAYTNMVITVRLATASTGTLQYTFTATVVPDSGVYNYVATGFCYGVDPTTGAVETTIVDDQAIVTLVKGGSLTADSTTANTGIRVVTPGVVLIISTENAGGVSAGGNAVADIDLGENLIFRATTAGTTTIQGFLASASGTTKHTFRIRVLDSCPTGSFSAADSEVHVNTVNEAALGNVDDTPVFADLATAWILIDARNEFATALSAGTWLASATNGAVVDIANGSVTAAGSLSQDVLVGTAGGDIRVAIAQPTALQGTPLRTTVTVTYGTQVIATKTLLFTGDLAKIEVSKVLGGKTNDENFGSFTTKTYDSAGNQIAWTDALLTVTGTDQNVIAADAGLTSASSAANGDNSFTCGVGAKGKTTLTVRGVTNAATVVSSAPFTVSCSSTPSTWTASMDKASYVPGDIAVVTISAKDSNGNAVHDPYDEGTEALTSIPSVFSYVAGDAGTVPVVTGSNLEAVVAPAAANFFVGGVKTYSFKVGSTEGDYNLSVILGAITTDVAKTVKYSVKSSSTTVSNADVLKSIVALIASINKQIQALQKLILARR